jgi:hypothetical protein
VTNENNRLLELLGDLCNGTLTEAKQAQLEQILATDAAARQMYHDFIDVHMAMVDRGLKKSALEDSPLTISALDPVPDLTIRTRPKSNLLSVGIWLASFAAILLVCFLAFWLIPKTGGNEVAIAPQSQTNEKLEPEPLYVAQFVSVSPEVVWAKGSSSPDFLLRARCGDRIKIDSGLVELEYFTGANLILQGPCSFVLTSRNSGRLEQGQVAGKVVGGDFFITTPTAKVLDLGTEFGISINESQGTDVCVFDGEVKVFSDSSEDGDSSLSLTEGMSASVDQDGKIDQKRPVDSKQFSRQVPDSMLGAVDQLSLVDLFSANSKREHRLAGVIAPSTGVADQSPWLRVSGPGHRTGDGYQETAWHPYVDGVFIPSKSGSQTQIDSNNTLVDLPSSQGRTWGPIWSRRKMDVEFADSTRDYWGTSTLEVVNSRLASCETGMLGIHSNAGVTFDLAALRARSLEPTEFRFVVSNLENSKLTNPSWSAINRFSADLRVYLDGKLVASRLDFAREDGELEMKVKIDGASRFLTLVSSDRGKDGFDHVVVIDPILKTKPKAGKGR